MTFSYSTISQAIAFCKAIDDLGGTMLRMNMANFIRMKDWALDLDREIALRNINPRKLKLKMKDIKVPSIPVVVDNALDDGTILICTPNGTFTRLSWDLEEREERNG